jgi:hypothetical protein
MTDGPAWGRAVAFTTVQETPMKPFVTAGAAALFCLSSATALAADKPAEPAKKPVATTAADSKAAKAAPKAAAVVETRNWAKADTNKDNLISPEEMEVYLKENPGPLRTAAK